MYEFLHQSRKDTVVFKGAEDTFQSLFDKFVSFASAKHIFEIGQRICSYWHEAGEKDPNAMEEQGRQVEVGHGQACHLLGLREHLSHESRLFPQQRQMSKAQGKRKNKSMLSVESDTWSEQQWKEDRQRELAYYQWKETQWG